MLTPPVPLGPVTAKVMIVLSLAASDVTIISVNWDAVMLPLMITTGMVWLLVFVFVNVAVTILFAFITIVGLADPVASPLQPLKVQPSAATAVRLMFSPKVHVWLPGVTVPLPTVITVRV